MEDELMTVEDKDGADFVVIIPPPGPPGQKGPRKCEMAVESIDNKVAFGVVFDDGDGMSRAVHGVPLEPGFVRVGVDGSIQDDALVPVPVVGEIETIQQAIGSHLAWPKDMIIYTSTTGFEPKDNVPPRFRLLYKFASTVMKESGNSIPVPCDFQIFGIERTIYLLHENILELLEFKMIGQSAISTYMAYLYSVFRDRPAEIWSSSDEHYAYNYNLHWILIVFWESEIFILNTLPHHPHPQDLEKALMRAVRSYNAQEGRVNKNPKIKNLVGCPKQPGGTECGYVVMRYMKDLIEDQEMKLLDKLVEE
ncbi:uncharacterized protein LOC141719345 [Apium graveolens]|uniref:uncharacterized protein LOC141719345 n=1 Tax=Apium graveolens TaxID=4045 RepID=UPI003D78D325